MSTALILPAELTIYVVGELRQSWLAWLEASLAAGDDAQVDGQAVEEIDGAGVQALLALARSLRQGQLRLRLQPASTALRQACLRLGAGHLLAHTEGAAA